MQHGYFQPRRGWITSADSPFRKLMHFNGKKASDRANRGYLILNRQNFDLYSSGTAALGAQPFSVAHSW